MRINPALVPLLVSALTVSACGGGDTAVTTAGRATVPAVDRRSQAELRVAATADYRDWREDTGPALREALGGVRAARVRGDAAGTAEALAVYATRARDARARLVRIRFPLAAWDPAAYLANALAGAVTSADRQRAGLRAGRAASPELWRAFDRAVVMQRTGDARVRAGLAPRPAPAGAAPAADARTAASTGGAR